MNVPQGSTNTVQPFLFASEKLAMPEQPKTFSGDLANPPKALASLCLQDRWVDWRWERGKNGKWTKPPYIARSPGHHASTSDPQTWGSHRDAVSAVLSGKMNGIGYCLKDSDIGAIDFDKCRNCAQRLRPSRTFASSSSIR